MKVYSYIRFSDPKQATGDSVSRQAKYAAEWAKKHGMVLDDTLTLRDEGLSAYHQKHVTQGALGAFLAAVSDGRVPAGSVLIVEALDRLSRASPIEAQAQLQNIILAGIRVVTAADEKEYSRETIEADPMALIYSLLLAIRANEESETKSRRVKAAVRRQCEAWIAGKFRGRIVNGRDPGWVRWNEEAGRFEHVPERAEAMRRAIALFLKGYGYSRIFDQLNAAELKATGDKSARWLYSLIRRPDLIGTRVLKADGEEFRLEGYYPPLISEDEYNRLLLTYAERSRAPSSVGGKSKIAGLFSGLGVATCGRCGLGVVARNQTRNLKKPNHTPALDRRYVCASCGDEKKSASVSAKYVERALFNFMGDQANYESLATAADRTGPLTAELAAVRAKIASTEKRVDALLNASLTDDGLPQAALRKMREMEADAAKLKDTERHLSAELAVLSKTVDISLFEKWNAIRDQVLTDIYAYDARLSCRRLIKDTFANIAFHFDHLTPSGDKGFALLLTARNGEIRRLIVDRKTGDLCLLEVIDADGVVRFASEFSAVKTTTAARVVKVAVGVPDGKKSH